jgi:Glycosyl hydrolases family 16
VAIDRSRYVLEFEELFLSDQLEQWVPHYLPHWTTPERSAARHEVSHGILRLRIEEDQPTWRDEDSGLRVSNLQSGSWSGPLGSARGQHRHVDGLRVVTPQPERRLYTPRAGVVEADLRAVADPSTMLAFWLIGFEAESPDNSGEICIVELFGDSIGTSASTLSIGVKAHHDPRLHDDMMRIRTKIDATTWHTYAAEWNPYRIRFFVDDQLVRTVEQGIDYPMQLMIDLFEFRPDNKNDPATYPKTGDVGAIRGYRRR